MLMRTLKKGVVLTCQIPTGNLRHQILYTPDRTSNFCKQRSGILQLSGTSGDFPIFSTFFQAQQWLCLVGGWVG